MLFKDICVDALHHLEVDGIALLRTFLRWQSAKVFCQQCGNGVGIAVTYDEELEVVTISETLLVEFDDAVVVDFVKVFWLGTEGALVVVINHLRNGVL